MGGNEGGKTSQRYELRDLFPDESPGVLKLFKLVGVVVVVALLAVALAYPFLLK